MADTYCSRAWDNISINLGSWEYKVCCLTGWRPLAGGPWMDQPPVVERRAHMLSGRWHEDCRVCMEEEAGGGTSDRLLWGGDRRADSAGSAFDSGCQLVVNLGNTCDMACRYCSPEASSVWAARLGAARSGREAASRLGELLSWARDNRDRFSMVRFGGGEPSLSEELYMAVDALAPRGMLIAIDTNLNANAAWADRFDSLLSDLIDAGNRVELRYSLDGIGSKQEWQRQGASWERQRLNFLRFGARPITYELALTLTPLTLEGMCDAIEWSIAMSPRLAARPRWTSASMVRNLFPPQPWFGSFAEDIARAISLLGSDDIDGGDLASQMSSWLGRSGPPGDDDRRSLVTELDLSASRWGGGDWRPIYPRLAAMLSEIPGHPAG